MVWVTASARWSIVVTATHSDSNEDELLSTNGGIVNSYGYNANEEQTSPALGRAAYTLAYGHGVQLTSITQDGSTVSIGYDAPGRRIG
jgi:hypothetical protein